MTDRTTDRPTCLALKNNTRRPAGRGYCVLYCVPHCYYVSRTDNHISSAGADLFKFAVYGSVILYLLFRFWLSIAVPLIDWGDSVRNDLLHVDHVVD